MAVAGGLAYVAIHKNDFDKAKDVLIILIGIFGTIVGFYFGSAEHNKGNDNNGNQKQMTNQEQNQSQSLPQKSVPPVDQPDTPAGEKPAGEKPVKEKTE